MPCLNCTVSASTHATCYSPRSSTSWRSLRLGLQPSVHAAAQARKDSPVSLAALYDKINNTEPELARALVTGSAQRLEPLVQEIRKTQKPMFPGYRVRVLDGNHLPASEKRLAPLRSFRGAALPGHSLVVYDPDAGLVVDLVPCEDAHAQERTLVPSLLATVQSGDLWIADRNFCTTAILSSWHHKGANSTRSPSCRSSGPRSTDRRIGPSRGATAPTSVPARARPRRGRGQLPAQRRDRRPPASAPAGRRHETTSAERAASRSPASGFRRARELDILGTSASASYGSLARAAPGVERCQSPAPGPTPAPCC